MTQENISPKYDVQCIAIVDGEGLEMLVPTWEAEIAGFRTIQVPQSLQTKEEIVAFIQEHAQAAVCNHRLWHPEKRSFSGAELVAALYAVQVPALLVTQYGDIDMHTSIRCWKSSVPVVLSLHEFISSDIGAYLEFCIAELQGNIPESRVPYRVMVQIMHVDDSSDEQIVVAHIQCWDHYNYVSFPLSLIPESLHALVVPDAWFFAHVNLKAASYADLYFREFEVAPTPEYEEHLVYCINALDGSGVDSFNDELALIIRDYPERLLDWK